MININLVPVDSRKKAVGLLSSLEAGIPREIIFGVGGGCVILLIAVHLLLLGIMGIKGVVLGWKQAQWQQVLPDKQNIDAIGTELKDLKQKESNIVNATAAKALDWSHKLNSISDAVVKGLWLKKINVDAGVLTIEGFVLSRGFSDAATVNEFVSNLKQDKPFMDDFASIEINTVIHRDKKGTTEISSFMVTAKLK